jgi:hypothetical protein
MIVEEPCSVTTLHILCAIRIADALLALLSYRNLMIAASVLLNRVDNWHLRYNKVITFDRIMW